MRYQGTPGTYHIRNLPLIQAKVCSDAQSGERNTTNKQLLWSRHSSPGAVHGNEGTGKIFDTKRTHSQSSEMDDHGWLANHIDTGCSGMVSTPAVKIMNFSFTGPCLHEYVG